MYLSRLILNPRSRQVRREIAQRYELHRTIMRAFPESLDSNERILFRLEIDPRSGTALLLVQSQGEPDWSWLETSSSHNYLMSFHEENPGVKQFEPRFATGQKLSFRLRANPTVKRDKKRCGLYREEKQLAWLERKAQTGGFKVLGVRIGNETNITGKLTRGDTHHKLQFLSVQFDGLLEVCKPPAFLKSVQQGIGSAKGMGFGLLSLAPA